MNYRELINKIITRPESLKRDVLIYDRGKNKVYTIRGMEDLSIHGNECTALMVDKTLDFSKEKKDRDIRIRTVNVLRETELKNLPPEEVAHEMEVYDALLTLAGINHDPVQLLSLCLRTLNMLLDDTPSGLGIFRCINDDMLKLLDIQESS